MSFMDAVKTCLSKYVGFSGRARRSEFWWFFLFQVLVSVVAGIIDRLIGTSLIQNLAGLALLLPGLAVGARRLHDTGRSGWWWLIVLIPIVGIIVLIVFWVADSQAGQNAHGPNPKGAAAPAA